MPISEIDAGTVRFQANGTDYVLQPTVDAIITVSRDFDGVQNALQKCRALDFDALHRVTCTGCGVELRDVRKSRQVAEDLFRAGLHAVMPKIVEYVVVLMRGGQPLPGDDQDGDQDGDDQGNG